MLPRGCSCPALFLGLSGRIRGREVAPLPWLLVAASLQHGTQPKFSVPEFAPCSKSLSPRPSWSLLKEPWQVALQNTQAKAERLAPPPCPPPPSCTLQVLAQFRGQEPLLSLWMQSLCRASSSSDQPSPRLSFWAHRSLTPSWRSWGWGRRVAGSVEHMLLH